MDVGPLGSYVRMGAAGSRPVSSLQLTWRYMLAIPRSRPQKRHSETQFIVPNSPFGPNTHTLRGTALYSLDPMRLSTPNSQYTSAIQDSPSNRYPQTRQRTALRNLYSSYLTQMGFRNATRVRESPSTTAEMFMD